jgi:hypothetical protein
MEYIESKFGTAKLTKPQVKANNELDEYFVDYWSYEWLEDAASALGADVGSLGVNAYISKDPTGKHWKSRYR